MVISISLRHFIKGSSIHGEPSSPICVQPKKSLPNIHILFCWHRKESKGYNRLHKFLWVATDPICLTDTRTTMVLATIFLVHWKKLQSNDTTFRLFFGAWKTPTNCNSKNTYNVQVCVGNFDENLTKDILLYLLLPPVTARPTQNSHFWAEHVQTNLPTTFSCTFTLENVIDVRIEIVNQHAHQHDAITEQ